MPRDMHSGNSVFRSILQRNYIEPRLTQRSLIASTKDSVDYVQRLGLLCRLPVHSGCVNTIHWNSTGEYLLSGSDDQFIAVTNPNNQEVLLKCKTPHRANIFSARFMPQSNDQAIVSCSGDGIVLYTELMAPYIKRMKSQFGTGGKTVAPVYERTGPDAESTVHYFNCHKSGTTYEVLTIPMEPRSFMSCGEDGTVRLFDLRQISGCHKTCCKDNILILSPAAVNAIDLAPISSNYLAVGSSDAIVRIYDRRYLSVIDFNDGNTVSADKHTRPIKAYPIPLPSSRQYRITCIRYSPEETELLVSYSSEYLYLFDLKHDGANVEDCFKGRYFGKRGNTPPPSLTTEQVTRRLRLRGDWSDTGPDARPEGDASGRVDVGQVRPQLQPNIMSRMTEVISRMLNDPRTRMGLTSQMQETSRASPQQATDSSAATTTTTNTTTTNTTTAFSVTDHSSDDSRPSTSFSAWRRMAANSLLANRREESSSNDTQQNSNPQTSNEDVEMFESATNDDKAQSPRSAQYQVDAASLNKELADLEMETREIVYDYLLMKYTGHRNARTMIKEATFWGNNYVMCGSDCGHIFTWDRRTGKLVMLMQADQHVVNCLQPHPELPYLASSGIDYDVKIWAPILQQKSFDEESAEILMERNAIMLEQTKDTITVPAAFMIRMLACIHSLRNRERNNTQPNSENNSQNDSNTTGDNNVNNDTNNNNNNNTNNNNTNNNNNVSDNDSNS